MKHFVIPIVCLTLLATTGQSEAKGKCDGIARCRCGSTQTAHYSLPRIYKGHNLWQAREWTKAFPHRSYAAVGLVVYQHGGGPTGHVSRIVELKGRCIAKVADDAGEYERDICKRGAIYVDPTGGSPFTWTASIFQPSAY